MADFPGTTYAALDPVYTENINQFSGPVYPFIGAIYTENTNEIGSTTRSALGAASDLTDTLGFLIPGLETSTRYIMRAFKTTAPTGYVYWEVFDVSDPAASEAPFPPAMLTDIVIVALICD